MLIKNVHPGLNTEYKKKTSGKNDIWRQAQHKMSGKNEVVIGIQ